MYIKQFAGLVAHKTYALAHGSYLRLRGLGALVFLKGSAYHCLVCGHSFRKFFSVGYHHSVLTEKKIIGGGFRENAICPYCGSIDRERLVYYFLQAQQLLHRNMRLLHVAPEKNIRKLVSGVVEEYISADLNRLAADVKMDIQDISFPDAHFDAIICNHVLEHVPDDLRAMRELFRVLKPGGWAILQVPFSAVMDQTLEDPAVVAPEERARIFGQPNHARMYGLDYPERLRSAGFDVKPERADPALAAKYALNPEELVFFCRK